MNPSSGFRIYQPWAPRESPPIPESVCLCAPWSHSSTLKGCSERPTGPACPRTQRCWDCNSPCFPQDKLPSLALLSDLAILSG